MQPLRLGAGHPGFGRDCLVRSTGRTPGLAGGQARGRRGLAAIGLSDMRRRRLDDRDDLPTSVLLRDYPFEMVRLLHPMCAARPVPQRPTLIERSILRSKAEKSPPRRPSGLFVPAFGYPVGPTSVGKGGQIGIVL